MAQKVYFKGSYNSDSLQGTADEKADSGLTAETMEATALVHSTQLDIYNAAHTERRSGVVCTIGPASRGKDCLEQLFNAGLNVARMNFSHGTHDYHTGTIGNCRAVAKQLGREICIALDTKGPEIRTGNFVDGKEVQLKLNSKVRLSVDPKDLEKGTAEKFYVDYTNITKVLKVGDVIFVDDGLISLRVKNIGANFVDTLVENAGAVSNHKGVNLPNVNVDLPALSDKDKKDLSLGVKLEVDLIFASFIRKPEDVRNIRAYLKSVDEKIGGRIQIISKIENHEGVRNFDAILKETDGVMVARGDLGIEIPAEKVFLAQKMMISKCNIAGKPIIVATQMLESMINNPRPTRAEVSDVANAVLDGADCVMLSGETAKGKYPLKAVEVMTRICREAESARNTYQFYQQLIASLPKPLPTPDSIASAAVKTCYEQQPKCMVVLTNSGDTARLVGKFRPPCPIIAVSGRKHAYTSRQLCIQSGVYAVTYDDTKGKPPADERVKVGVVFARDQKWLKQGDFVVAVHADQMGIGFANLVRVLKAESFF